MQHYIKGLVRRDDTIVRREACNGLSTTWTADDQQMVVSADSVDLTRTPPEAFHSCIYRLTGDPTNPAYVELPGYPHMVMRLRESEYASYWGGPCLAVDGHIYQYLPTSKHPYMRPDLSFWPDNYLAHTKLIYSPDDGRTWCNQDGSSPVVWDDWDKRSPENMIFFDEQPEGAFTFLTFLQMGKDYSLNKDGYVYVYSTNGGEDGTANELVMFRVPKERVLDRDSYEFFAGRDPDGSATWTNDISARSPVHTFPRGWVSGKMPGSFPMGWLNSVVYNPPLEQYMMVASGIGCSPSGGWFDKPSYLGFWVAPSPWGPFTQVQEELAWAPEGESASRAFGPAIAPKWISADGTSFWFSWLDYAFKVPDEHAGDEYNPDRDAVEALGQIIDDREFARAFDAYIRKTALHWSFNLQRVDLIVE